MSWTPGIALAALIASAVAPASFAQAGFEQVSIRVSFADLNLTRPEGGVTLLNRIQAAAKTVCGNDSVQLSVRPLVSNCRRIAVENAVRRLDIAMLTLAWGGEEPKPSQLALN